MKNWECFTRKCFTRKYDYIADLISAGHIWNSVLTDGLRVKSTCCSAEDPSLFPTPKLDSSQSPLVQTRHPLPPPQSLALMCTLLHTTHTFRSTIKPQNKIAPEKEWNCSYKMWCFVGQFFSELNQIHFFSL